MALTELVSTARMEMAVFSIFSSTRFAAGEFFRYERSFSILMESSVSTSLL